MSWKRYQNELIVLAAILIMSVALLYKSSTVSKIDDVKIEVSKLMDEMGEIIALKKQWGNPELSKKVLKIKEGLAANKVKSFDIRSNKLTAVLEGLSEKEMSNTIIRIENMAVQIMRLNVKSDAGTYKMEIICKW